MHILLIHQAFTPPEEAGGTRHYEMSRCLVQKSHRVTVVASAVSYLTGRLLPPSDRGRAADRARAGIEIVRAWSLPVRRGTFFPRVMSFLTFAISSFLCALEVRKVDVVWGTTPPIFQAVSAYAVARLKRAPLLLEVRDLWPDFAVETRVLRNRPLIWMARRLESFLYRRADRIVINSPGFIHHLVKRGVPEEKIDLVPNGTEVAMFDPDDRGIRVRQGLGVEGKFVALYAGAFGMANDLETVLSAASRLARHPEITFVLVGDGKERPNLIRRAEGMNLRNVVFVPPQPKARMPAFLAASDVCIGILKAIPMFTTTYPNKIFDYMAAGRPTVLAIDGAIREVLEAADGGIFAEPGNPNALAQAVLAYCEDPELRRRHGRNARSYVASHFDREELAKELLRSLDSVNRRMNKRRRVVLVFKRSLDIATSSIGLLLLSPLIGIIALAIKFDDGGRVFYSQQRIGKNGRGFRCFKFRSMMERAETIGRGLEVGRDDPRFTRVGRFLRHWTLDEIPQLFNVLRDDMSMVGPRPTVPGQVARYTPRQRRRLEVKPGMTGWAWIQGRNSIPWDERIELDIWYVDHWSLWLDFKILLKTFPMVLRHEGLYGAGDVVHDL